MGVIGSTRVGFGFGPGKDGSVDGGSDFVVEDSIVDERYGQNGNNMYIWGGGGVELRRDGGVLLRMPETAWDQGT